MLKPLDLVVMNGVGDTSWVISKLVNCGRRVRLHVVYDPSERARPYLELFPFVESVEYSHDLTDFYWLYKCWNAKFSDIDGADGDGRKFYIACNNWVDNGNRLEDWLSDLPVDFHYDLPLPAWAKQKAAEMLPPERKYICIHVGSRGSTRVLSGWYERLWSELIRRIHADNKDAVFVLIGAETDADLSTALAALLADMDVVVAVGSPILLSLALIQQCSYMVGFASGMSIMANVMRVPVAMLYPYYLEKLMYAWPCPESIASGSYQGMLWHTPQEVYNRIGHIIEQSLR